MLDVEAQPRRRAWVPRNSPLTFYTLNAFELVDDGAATRNTADPENGNDEKTAAKVDFLKAQNGSYFSAYIWGYYDSMDDVAPRRRRPLSG